MKKLIVTFIALIIIGIGLIIMLYNPPQIKADNKKIMSAFVGIYEASGAEQLSDGRVVIIEDEKSSAIKNILTFESSNRVVVNQLVPDQSKIKTKIVHVSEKQSF